MTISASTVDSTALSSWAAYRQDGDAIAGENDLATSLAGSGWTIVRPSQLGVSTLDPDNEYFEVRVGNNSGPVAAAFAAQRNGVLVIAFRGSDETGDQLATINNQSGYFDAYRNFLDAALLYAADPANGVTQILVTGHSLGGVMAEWFANEYAAEVSALELPVSIATFGSPGTSISTPPTVLAQSIVHFGHTGDQIFEHQGTVGGFLAGLSRQGTSIEIDLPNVNANDPRLNFFEHDMFLYQRSAPAIANSYFGQQLLDDPASHRIIVDTVISAADDQITLDFSSRTVPLAIIGDSGVIAPGFDDSDIIQGGSAGDWIDGGNGNDILYGNSGNDALFGGVGNDLLLGGPGNDTMTGGIGNDIYWLNQSGDIIVENGGEGTDAVNVFVSGYTLADNVEDGWLVAAGTLTGNGLANMLNGSAGNDILYGNSGNDALIGGAGNDLLLGGTGNDTMIGGTGNDIYWLNQSGDSIVENAGEGTDAVNVFVSGYTLADNVEDGWLVAAGTLAGNGLANVLNGASGADVLNGAGGSDTLVGNGGNDTFVFVSGQAIGDGIVDFAGNGAAAGDSLQFAGFGTLAQGASFTQVGTTNQWQIHSGLDGHNEVITLQNSALVNSSDYLFL
jgi:Ca2+-binding RTX toxin-like protein